MMLTSYPQRFVKYRTQRIAAFQNRHVKCVHIDILINRKPNFRFSVNESRNGVFPNTKLW